MQMYFIELKFKTMTYNLMFGLGVEWPVSYTTKYYQEKDWVIIDNNLTWNISGQIIIWNISSNSLVGTLEQEVDWIVDWNNLINNKLCNG